MGAKKIIKKDINNIFYKTNFNRGISLIVLVITIIIIIILTAAVVVSLVNNNPMSEASDARIKSDVSNMQAIFTNALGKVMAENQDIVELEASPLNSVTSGVKSAVGNAVYKLNNGTVGQIIFDDNVKKENEYYTGKKLPIYNEKTTWYVDEEGIISLEVGNKKYGDGKIIKNIKIVTEVIQSEEYIKSKAIVKIEISSEDEIESIKFGGNDIPVPERKDGKYVVEIEVTENGEYEVEVSGKGGGKNRVKVEVKEIDELNNEIQIKSTVTITPDYVKGNIGLEITYGLEVESIKINRENVAVPGKSGGKYVVNKEVLENGIYEVEVKGKDGTINKTIVKVTDITEDMEIWNRADMEKFRDKVNSGRTFETKKATVMADINLGGSSNNWIPIGNYILDSKLVFKGTFEGNEKTISNIYISTTSEGQGLFGYVTDCNIQNVKLKGTVKGGGYTGGIVGKANINSIIDNCNVSGSITGSYGIGGIAGYVMNKSSKILNCKVDATVNGQYQVGGIVGTNIGIVKYCLKSGNTTASYNSNGHSFVGGIAGECGIHNGENGNYIFSCVNKGNVTGATYVGGIVGEMRQNVYIDYCYSVGTIQATSTTNAGFIACGGIVGETYGNVSHSFASGTVSGTGNYVGGIIGIASSPINVKNIEGLSDVYRYNDHVGASAWDKNLSGGLYGTITNINWENHSYINGKHTTTIGWYAPEFDRIDSITGLPKLKWEK